MTLEKFDPKNENSCVIRLSIAVDQIQPIAGTHIGRQLTDVELNRIYKAWTKCDVEYILRQAVVAIIKFVSDSKTQGWNKIDEEFLREQNK